jgi:hypothetical protein
MSNEKIEYPEPTDLVERYLELVDMGADFEDPRLEELRRRMTEDEFRQTAFRLRDEAETAERKKRALEAYGRIRGWDRKPK